MQSQFKCTLVRWGWSDRQSEREGALGTIDEIIVTSGRSSSICTPGSEVPWDWAREQSLTASSQLVINIPRNGAQEYPERPEVGRETVHESTAGATNEGWTVFSGSCVHGDDPVVLLLPTPQ
jgi:hypothetical protein